jgi:hypothetical protein
MKELEIKDLKTQGEIFIFMFNFYEVWTTMQKYDWV